MPTASASLAAIQNILANTGKQLQPSPNALHSTETYLSAYYTKALTQEIAKLRQLFESALSFSKKRSQFLEHCLRRLEVQSNAGLNSFDTTNNPVTALYFAIYTAIEGPKPFGIWQNYFLAKIVRSFYIEMAPAKFENTVTMPRLRYSQGISSDLASEIADLSILRHLLLIDGILFDCRQIARFSYRQYQVLYTQLRNKLPTTLLDAIFNHNAHYRQLYQQLQTTSSLEQQLSALINGLRQGANLFGDARPQASLAITAWLEWFHLLPKVEQKRIYALRTDKGKTLEAIIETTLIQNKECVALAATDIHHIKTRSCYQNQVQQRYSLSQPQLVTHYIRQRRTGISSAHDPNKGLRLPIDAELLAKLVISQEKDLDKLLFNQVAFDIQAIIQQVNFHMTPERFWNSIAKQPASIQELLLDSILQIQANNEKRLELIASLLGSAIPMPQFKKLLLALDQLDLGFTLASTRYSPTAKMQVTNLYWFAEQGQKEKLILAWSALHPPERQLILPLIDRPESHLQYAKWLTLRAARLCLLVSNLRSMLSTVIDNRHSPLERILCLVAFLVIARDAWRGGHFTAAYWWPRPSFTQLSANLEINLENSAVAMPISGENAKRQERRQAHAALEQQISAFGSQSQGLSRHSIFNSGEARVRQALVALKRKPELSRLDIAATLAKQAKKTNNPSVKRRIADQISRLGIAEPEQTRQGLR